MKTTKTILGDKAREKVLEGVNAIYEPVRRTFGPQGKNALLYRTFNRGPRITNDGHTVADVQIPKDIFVRSAAETFKEACKRTNEKVGDGTTGTAIIGGHLFNEVYKALDENKTNFTLNTKSQMGVMTLKRQLLESAEKVKQAIRDKAQRTEKLEDLEKIAIVSVEDIDLGKTIAKMVWDIGVDGFIDVVEGYKGEIETEVMKGQRFPAKIPNKAFVNNPSRYEMVASDCHVLLTNYELDNASDVAKSISSLQAFTSKLIVIAPKFSDNVLVNMIAAHKAGYFIYPVAVPSLRTEQFEDVAIFTGANFIDKNKGRTLKVINASDLGFLEKLVVKDTEAKEDAVATGGKGQQNVLERIEILKGQLAETPQENFKKLLERRIASMASAVGVIRVGDSTQASSLYTKLKIEDAVYACKAALKGGYVKGGGLCLKEIAESNLLEDGDVLKSTLMAPYNQIQASVDGGVEISEDIIDPADAIFYAIEHAVNVVANLATVDIITQEVDDPVYGEGEFAIARALNEYVLSQKVHLGQLKENEVEMERDMLNGLSVDEMTILDR